MEDVKMAKCISENSLDGIPMGEREIEAMAKLFELMAKRIRTGMAQITNWELGKTEELEFHRFDVRVHKAIPKNMRFKISEKGKRLVEALRRKSLKSHGDQVQTALEGVQDKMDKRIIEEYEKPSS